MENRKKATLCLDNGQTFEGYALGCTATVSGEIVFSTAMTGYPEQLTDPTYHGQILCLTYPMIGNYGMPSEETCKKSGLMKNYESEKVQPSGLVIFDYCEDYSNWEAVKSLEQWMKEQGLTGIMGVDTREVAKSIRDAKGPLRGRIQLDGVTENGFSKEVYGPADVTCKEVISYSPCESCGNRKKVVLIDCGVKHSVVRSLVKSGCEVIRVPYNYDFTGMEYDGVFVSNGPGDPTLCYETVALLKKVMETGKPVFGYNLGFLLMARAAGCETKRLDRAHRSANQPVRENGTNKAYITSQNTGYTVVESSIPEDWDVYFTNLNDGAVDGIRHKNLPFMGMQFDPAVCVRLNSDMTPFKEFIQKL